MNEHSFMPAAPTATATKQEQILHAALELFTERTFAGAAVPLVAERAGVATGTIYRYFPSKEALLNAVYQQWKGELKRRLVDEHEMGELFKVIGLARGCSFEAIGFAVGDRSHTL